MIITNNFNITQKQQTKPAFKGPVYFQQIKAIPDMICGCCGKKTLHVDKFIKAVTPLSKPLSVQVENGVLNYLKWKFPKAWETIQSFTERFPDQSLDEIIHTEDNDVNEQYTELKKAVVEDIDTQKETYDFATGIERERFVGKVFFDLTDNSRAYMVSSAEVIEHLLPLKQYLVGPKKEVFEQFEIYSCSTPQSTRILSAYFSFNKLM